MFRLRKNILNSPGNTRNRLWIPAMGPFTNVLYPLMHSCNTPRDNVLSFPVHKRQNWVNRNWCEFLSIKQWVIKNCFEARFIGDHALVVSSHTRKSKYILFKFIHKILFLWLVSSVSTRKSSNSRPLSHEISWSKVSLTQSNTTQTSRMSQ